MVNKDYEELLKRVYKVNAGSSLKHPIVVDVEKDFILEGDKTFDVMMDQVNEETTSSLTNIRILDYENARVVYDMLQGP